MPYVYYDELEDGMEAADVTSVEEYNALEAQRAELQEQYDTLYKSIVDGSLVIDASFDADVHPEVSAITVDYQG